MSSPVIWQLAGKQAVDSDLHGADGDGNSYYLPANRETIVVQAPDGVTAYGPSVTEARAMLQRVRAERRTPAAASRSRARGPSGTPLRHVTIWPGEHKALKRAGTDMRALPHEAEAADRKEGVTA
jgi:hypothetical protein